MQHSILQWPGVLPCRHHVLATDLVFRNDGCCCKCSLHGCTHVFLTAGLHPLTNSGLAPGSMRAAALQAGALVVLREAQLPGSYGALHVPQQLLRHDLVRRQQVRQQAPELQLVAPAWARGE